MANKKSEAFNFEKSLIELEQIVKEMEGGSLNLKDSLSHFERGITLTRRCQDTLQQAEQKVQILVGEGKTAELQNYAPRSDKALPQFNTTLETISDDT